MWKRSIIYAVVLFLSINYAQLLYTDPDYDWDILVFSQHWPITVCKKWSAHGRRTCNLPKKKNAWTIHGLWPTKSGTRGPRFCNSTLEFDMKQIKSIENHLEESWINIDKDTVPYDFWKHEWDKHGTCAVMIEPLNSELKFFTKVLDLLPNYMMTDILKVDNILPSDDDTYKIADFYQPIKNKLKTEPVIKCQHVSGTQYIHELHICFTKDFQQTDCVPIDKSEMINDDTVYLTNCNSSQAIIYPQHANKPQGLQPIQFD